MGSLVPRLSTHISLQSGPFLKPYDIIVKYALLVVSVSSALFRPRARLGLVVGPPLVLCLLVVYGTEQAEGLAIHLRGGEGRGGEGGGSSIVP